MRPEQGRGCVDGKRAMRQESTGLCADRRWGPRESQRWDWYPERWPMTARAVEPSLSWGTLEEQVGGLNVPLRSRCRSAHLDLGGLQLAARPLPGGHLLLQLLPQPRHLRLQGSHPGPQGQLRPGLLLQQLLEGQGRMDVRCGQKGGRRRGLGDEGGLRSPGRRAAGPLCCSALCSA